jgi:AcrR family transcriptional regulator
MDQLPRGRHRLSREEVEASQRGRMLAAMADAVAEKTFARTSVTDVVKRAGVSRETFYEHFADKEACFLAAFEAAADLLRTAMAEEFARSPGGTDGTPTGAVRKALTIYLETLASEPAVAQTFLVEVYAAGPEARVRRAAVQKRFADTIALAIGAADDEERFAAEALVGAISSLVTMRVSIGEAERLPELIEPLMVLIERLLGTRAH